jgi:uncharacterized protein YciI
MQRRTVLARTVLGLAAAAVASPALATTAAGPPTYFVLSHTPGRIWDHGKAFRNQPGIDQHVAYWSGYADKGQIVLGGPFLDNSGGMMILDVPTPEAAHAMAEADPTVKSSLLAVTVRPWLAALARH